MKSTSFFAAVVAALSALPAAFAAPNFAGADLYYAAGLTGDEQTTLLTGLQSAGVKVLRVWLDGQSGTIKGTKIDDFPSLEGSTPGDYDDTLLQRLDFMIQANKYGIKLSVSLHSYNTPAAGNDFYGQWYGIGDFYTNSDAINYFKNRIAHVLSHVNKNTNQTWSESSDYIFAIEAQNEAMHDQADPDALTAWQCTMAGAIKDGLNNSKDILVTTGGGAWLANSLLDPYFSCDALDLLAIHAYGAGDLTTDALTPYVSKAQGAGKMLIMQEWGACYTDASNNNCNGGSPLDSGTRDSNIKTWTSNIVAAGIPPMYWQILPNEDPHEDWDYEVGINGVNWGALQSSLASANQSDAAFDFSQWLL